MNASERPPNSTAVGGIGCKHCKFWNKYTDPTTKELMGLSGEWGRCKHPVITQLALNFTGKELQPYESSKLKLTVLAAGLGVVASTSHDYICPGFQGIE